MSPLRRPTGPGLERSGKLESRVIPPESREKFDTQVELCLEVTSRSALTPTCQRDRFLGRLRSWEFHLE